LPCIRPSLNLLPCILPKHTWFSVHMCALFQSERCDITLWYKYVHGWVLEYVCTVNNGTRVRTRTCMCTYSTDGSTCVPYGTIWYHGTIWYCIPLLWQLSIPWYRQYPVPSWRIALPMRMYVVSKQVHILLMKIYRLVAERLWWVGVSNGRSLEVPWYVRTYVTRTYTCSQEGRGSIHTMSTALVVVSALYTVDEARWGESVLVRGNGKKKPQQVVADGRAACSKTSTARRWSSEVSRAKRARQFSAPNLTHLMSRSYQSAFMLSASLQAATPCAEPPTSA
jgi:hypothetical protein